MHDERVGAGLPRQADAVVVRGRIGRFVDREVGHVVADPRAFLIGPALRIPPDIALAVAPRLAVGAGRGAVVHDVAIGGPVEPPAQADVVVWFAAGRQISVRSGEHARVNPVAARGAAVVFQDTKAAQMALRGHVIAVDFLENLQRAGLVFDVPVGGLARLRLVVPGQIQKALIAWQSAAGIQRFEAFAELVGKPQIRARIAGRVLRFFVPLQQAMGIGKAAFAFRVVRRRARKILRS